MSAIVDAAPRGFPMSLPSLPAEPVYEVVWPLGQSRPDARASNERVSDLRTKTVAELWDYVFHGDKILSFVRERLAARFPGIRFVSYEVFGNLHGPQQRELLAAMPGLLKQHRCDAVISLIGA